MHFSESRANTEELRWPPEMRFFFSKTSDMNLAHFAKSTNLLAHHERSTAVFVPVEINRSASFTDGDAGVAAGGEVWGKRRSASSCKHWPLPERLAWPLLSWQLYQKLDGIFIMTEMEIKATRREFSRWTTLFLLS